MSKYYHKKWGYTDSKNRHNGLADKPQFMKKFGYKEIKKEGKTNE